MCLSSSIVVVTLSIIAASSRAFAPTSVRTSTKTSSSSLRASNELSSLLSEYSGSTSKITSVAVDRVSDAASNVVTKAQSLPPPPAVRAGADEPGMDTLVKAASMAQDAAGRAAEAAAMVASKGAAAVKASSAMGTSVAGGVQLKPLVGGVFVPTSPDQTKLPFQVDPAKLDYDSAFDASSRAKQNLDILKENFMGVIESVKEASGGVARVKLNAGESLLDIDSLKIGSLSISPAVADIISSLHLKEYGGWYTAAAMAIFASQQRTAGKEQAAVEFESELAHAREKASEAASAAGLAAEGAKTAKKLAIKMEQGMRKDGGKALLESSRSKMAQMEKDMMEKQLIALQAEVVSLRSQVTKLEDGRKEETAMPTVKTEIQEEYPTKNVLGSGLDDDGRIIELLKEIDEKNKKKNAEKLEKKREQEAKFVAAEKAKAESKEMTKGVEAAQANAEVARKTAAKKKASTKSSAKAQSIAKRNTASKSPAKKASSDNWASLAESTLKRKTVAQLTEYLTGKGVSVTDGSGKSLRKAALLEAVKSL